MSPSACSRSQDRIRAAGLLSSLVMFRALLGERDGGTVPVIRRNACFSCKESELSSTVGFETVILCFKPLRTFFLARTRWGCRWGCRTRGACLLCAGQEQDLLTAGVPLCPMRDRRQGSIGWLFGLDWWAVLDSNRRLSA